MRAPGNFRQFGPSTDKNATTWNKIVNYCAFAILITESATMQVSSCLPIFDHHTTYPSASRGHRRRYLNEQYIPDIAKTIVKITTVSSPTQFAWRHKQNVRALDWKHFDPEYIYYLRHTFKCNCSDNRFKYCELPWPLLQNQTERISGLSLFLSTTIAKSDGSYIRKESFVHSYAH